mgnify:CR=1 FL=1
MFAWICLTLIALLIVRCISPNFSSLQPGETYRSRKGKVVKIQQHVRMGEFDIFVAHNGVRYFPNGERVGDLKRWSDHRLLKRVKA